MFNPFNSNKKKAVIYTRVSTLTQADEGYGLDYQLETCKDMCLIKNFEIIKIYTDEGVSGTTEPKNRKAMKQLIEDADDKKFQAVVFYSLDRLAREISITLNIIKYFETNNIEIISCKENIDTTTYQGKFKLSIYASISELELNTIKSRLSMGREVKKITDGDIGGRVPYGYVRVDNKIEISPPQAKIVVDIYKSYYNKKLSINKIANILNLEQIKPPKKGKKWYASTVKTILDNKDKYKGNLINNNHNDIYWPKILG